MTQNDAFINRSHASSALLTRYGVNIEKLLQLAHPKPGDNILIAGSLVEGIGTPYSDVDIYIIGENRSSLAQPKAQDHHFVNAYEPDYEPLPRHDRRLGDLHETFDYLSDSPIACNVAYWTYEEVQNIIEEVHSSYKSTLTNSADLSPSSYAKGMLIHRLLNCIRYKASERLDSLIGSLSISEVCYVGYRKFAASYDVFRDVVGAWQAGDLNSSLLALKNHVTDQMMALTFLAGQTNPNPKWVFQKIDTFPAELTPIANRYRAFVGMSTMTTEAKIDAVEYGCELLDAIFLVCQGRLDSNPTFLSTERSIQLTREEYSYRLARRDEPSEQLRLHYLYREKLFRSDGPTCRSLIGDLGAQSRLPRPADQ